MTSKSLTALFLIVASLFISACNQQETATEIPGPIAMTEEAVGHYCSMNIFEHKGPKAQMFLKNIKAPIWFSQVRDAVAFLRSPEETQEAIAVYVNDMGEAKNWDFPEDDTWIDAKTAFYVINSSKTGGMGAPEAIPFGSNESAAKFQSDYGGDIVKLADIPDDYVLGPVDINPQSNTTTGAVQ